MDKKTVIASAAAALFVLGAAGGVSADSHGGGHAEDGKVKCDGANACKGQGACHTASHDCSGKNSCKGKGWVYLSAEACEAAGGTLADK